MQPDRPIETTSSDRLGFGTISEQVASAVLHNDFSEGFVIGIEEPWGSGKSSIAKLTISHLNAEEISTVEFSPWLVGNRDAMIVELIKSLRVVLNTEPQALEALKKFSDIAARLSPFAVLAEEWGAPGGKILSQTLKTLGPEAGRISNESMGKAKATITCALAKISKPVVVFVDDLDRLDPAEAVEVLRLVRAVADFPNVIYILAYDLDVLSSNIESTLKISDGESFLEKIIQVSFRVPNADPFDLKNWFGIEVIDFFKSWNLSEEATERLHQLLNIIAPSWLDTPRDIIRILNSLKLYASPLKNQIDPADIVFLQMIRTVDPEFYSWLRRYTQRSLEVEHISINDDADRKERTESAQNILKGREQRVRPSAIYLKEFIPGVDWYSLIRHGEDIDWKRALQPNYDNGIAEKRWFSPEHHRLYTAYSKPAGSFDDNDFSVFIDSLAREPEATAIQFSKFAKTQRAQGGTMADVLIERFRILLSSDTPPAEDALIGLVNVLAQVGDTLPHGHYFGTRSQASKVAQQAVKLLPQVSRRSVLAKISREGQALGLLIDFFRDQTFKHGNKADPSRIIPINERELSPEEFSLFGQEIIWRIQFLKPEDLLARDDLINFLYAWSQGGKSDATRSWIAQQSVNDDGLIHVLERVILSSSGSSVPAALKEFFGHARTVERLKRIKVSDGDGLQKRAEAILIHIDQARFF